MLDLVIDTSVFRNDPWRKKAEFSALARLGKSGKIKLHIPYFVQREFITYLFSEYYDPHLTAIEKSISKIARNLPDDLSDRLIDLEKQFIELKNDIAECPERDFLAWADSIEAIVHPIGNNHGRDVANAYFDGMPPFREKKKRDDIPDAFIWQAINDLSGNLERLFAVVSDKGLRSACETKANIVLFETLADFLASDYCSPLLIEDNLSDEISKLLNLIPLFETRLKEAVADQISEIVYGEEVESALIPDDNNTATCLGVEEVDSLEIETEDAQYYGDGQIVVKFKMMADALLNYAVFKADYYSMDDKTSARIGTSPLNKHYYDAEEIYPLEISGTISLEVPLPILKKANLSEEDTKYILDGMVITVDEIAVSEDDENLWE